MTAWLGLSYTFVAASLLEPRRRLEIYCSVPTKLWRKTRLRSPLGTVPLKCGSGQALGASGLKSVYGRLLLGITLIQGRF